MRVSKFIVILLWYPGTIHDLGKRGTEFGVHIASIFGVGWRQVCMRDLQLKFAHSNA